MPHHHHSHPLPITHTLVSTSVCPSIFPFSSFSVSLLNFSTHSEEQWAPTKQANSHEATVSEPQVASPHELDKCFRVELESG